MLVPALLGGVSVDKPLHVVPSVSKCLRLAASLFHHRLPTLIFDVLFYQPLNELSRRELFGCSSGLNFADERFWKLNLCAHTTSSLSLRGRNPASRFLLLEPQLWN